jgi:hypothetical protein
MKKPFSPIFSLLYLCTLLSPFYANGQSDTRKDIQRKFEQYAVRSLTEKLFVHTDRSFYVVGESIWFKIYYMDGVQHRPMDLSKVAYLELVDKDQNSVVQGKVALSEGKGDGSLNLPSGLPSGSYVLRAYTNWMKNFSPDYYFEKTITLANPFERTEAKPTEKTALTYDVQFFPEGGNLIRDMENKVAFRAIGPDGKGIAFQGAVLNQHNDTLVRFEPLRFGIGHFLFTPTPSGEYRVVVQDAHKRNFTYALPVIRENGYAMQVSDSTADLLKIVITARLSNQDASDEAYSSVHLLVHTHQIVRINESKNLRQGKAIFLVNKKELDGGISHFTLFNEARRPIAERLVFIKPTRKLNVEARTNQTQYGSRDKMSLDLLTATSEGTPVSANLSASVFLIDSLQNLEQPQIESYVWLKSELSGRIESPEYYFRNETPETKLALDNLMLTHGWRRFKWEDVLQKPLPVPAYLPEIGGHFVEGKVIDNQTGKPAPFIGTYLASPSKRIQLFVSKSDTLGRIRFEVKNFAGPREIVVQTNTRQDSTYRLEINSPFSAQPSSYPLLPFSFNANWKNQLICRSINMQTQNAFTKSLFRQEDGTDSLAFYGVPHQKYYLDAYTRFPTMEEVMREYVPGVWVRKRQRKFVFMVVDRVHVKSVFKDDPLILMDGVPVFDTDKIIAFDPLKVKKLEVMESRYFLGPLSFPGIVSYSTYQNDMAGLPLDPKALVLSYEGLQIPREFYSPVYETAEERESRIPDFRNLLYWTPNIQTDNQGKHQLTFYTSDQPGTYAVVVQGMTVNGQFGSTTITFEVKAPL